jgi:hypothetical protein
MVQLELTKLSSHSLTSPALPHNPHPPTPLPLCDSPSGSRTLVAMEEGGAVAAAATRALRALEAAAGTEPLYCRLDFVEVCYRDQRERETDRQAEDSRGGGVRRRLPLLPAAAPGGPSTRGPPYSDQKVANSYR